MREEVESELEEEDMTEVFLLRSAKDGGNEGAGDGCSTRIMQ